MIQRSILQLRRWYVVAHDAIRNRGFNAVIFTRRKSQKREELARTQPLGPTFDLFVCDYVELNLDINAKEALAHTFITEVYDTTTQRKVWAIKD
ncbi:MAG: hypothetical protein P8M18_00960 [Woeseiaceae bacterium]|nr:hypothetical protein [Woeseiaceae bacterium]